MSTPRTVVITGASAGIGRATAQQFAARGDNVALLARGSAGLEGAVKDVHNAGGQALAIPTDVAEYGEVESAAADVEGYFGPIDIWVNVAFVSVFAPFHQISADEYRRVTEVSYLGFVHGTMAALGRMRRRDAGTIVQVGSALGSRAIPLQSAYCGAKHAINGFTESVRTELMHEHSNVNITVVRDARGRIRPSSPGCCRDCRVIPNPSRRFISPRSPHVPWCSPPNIRAVSSTGSGRVPPAQSWASGSRPHCWIATWPKTGYASQQTSQRVSPERPNNLWEPRDDEDGGDHGAHGVFDSNSLDRSPQLWVSQHARAALAGAGAATVAATAALALRRRPVRAPTRRESRRKGN